MRVLRQFALLVTRPLAPFVAVMLSVSQAVAADLAREGSYSIRFAWSGAFDALEVGENHLVFVYTLQGVVTNNAGEGIFHNMSANCIGMGSSLDGAENNSGNCVYTDADGDKIFDEWEDEGTFGVGAKGSATLIGGTGKYAGISGGGQYERFNVPAAAEGTFQGYIPDETGTYRLP
ncbi:MAG: hypothetical protein ACE5MG_08920 [Candidatus Methylomirabilales bacterium]